MNNPATTKLVMAFSAAVEPMLISASKRLITQLVAIDHKGSCVLGSTYHSSVSLLSFFLMNG